MIHRDIKPGNLLLDKDGVLKVGDFGLATHVSEVVKNNQYSTQMLTLDYASPERVNGQDYGKPYDMWSIGVVLHMLALFRTPFGRNMSKIFRVDYDRSALDDINPLFKKLILGVLKFDPKARLDINEFYDMLQEYRDQKENISIDVGKVGENEDTRAFVES